MQDDNELGRRAPPLVSVRRCINTDGLPKDHKVNKDACQMTNTSLQRVLVPVLCDSKNEVVCMVLPEKISKLVELFSLS